MSKMSKAIAVLGVVAGLGVAALPLSTYAAPGDPNTYSQSANAQVQIEVEGAISIATNAGTMEGGLINLGNIMPGGVSDPSETLEVTVASNYTNKSEFFNLYINGLETQGEGASAKAVMKGKNTGSVIEAGVPGANKSAWGYAYSATEFAADTTPTFVAIPATAEKVNGGTKLSTDGAVADTTKATNTSYFKFQASASNTQTADIYTGTVVFTAVVE